MTFKILLNQKENKWLQFKNQRYFGDVILKKINSKKYMITILLAEETPMGFTKTLIDQHTFKSTLKLALLIYNNAKNELKKYK